MRRADPAGKRDWPWEGETSYKGGFPPRHLNRQTTTGVHHRDHRHGLSIAEGRIGRPLPALAKRPLALLPVVLAQGREGGGCTSEEEATCGEAVLSWMGGPYYRIDMAQRRSSHDRPGG